MSLLPTERWRRWLWPAELVGRVRRLLALGVVLLLGCSLFALRQLSLQSGSEQIADLVAAQVSALRAMQSSGSVVPRGPQGDPLLEVLVQQRPPEIASKAWLPFARQLVERLEARLGSEVLMEERDLRTWLWISPARPGGAWLGLAVPPFRQQATLLSTVVLLLATLLVGLGGMLLAGWIARPLQRLADAAPAMVAGEALDPEITETAPLEVRQLAAALTDAGRVAREQARQRELMLAGLSHDLRTPLARLRYALAIEPLRDASLNAQAESDLDELDAMIGLFLDLGRGQAWRTPVETVVLGEFLNHWLPRISEQRWQLNIAPDFQLRAPPLALRRLLGNLIRNAERHGKPPFLISAVVLGGRPLIEVIDGGHGIPVDQRQRLLRPFERGDSPAEGSGLGLAIATDLARLLGAELSLRDAEPQGLCVRLAWLGK